MHNIVLKIVFSLLILFILYREMCRSEGFNIDIEALKKYNDLVKQMIDGKLEIPGKLVVKGGIEVTGGVLNIAQSFKVGGELDKFYPIVFKTEPVWYDEGTHHINIIRPFVHKDSEWRGSMILNLFGHNDNGGHGSEYNQYFYTWSRRSFLGGIVLNPGSARVTVWLAGDTTYYWTSNGVILENGNPNGTDIKINGVEINIKDTADPKLASGFHSSQGTKY